MKAKSIIPRGAALLFIFVLSYATVFATADAQPDAQFIKLERGAVDEITADSDKATARFPVTLESIQAEGIKLRIVDVVLDKRRESRLVGAFTPKIETATDSRSQAILIDIDLTKVVEQGTYTLAVEAAVADGSKRQLLELQMIVPAAKLRPPGIVVVQEEVYPFGSSLKKYPLELMEISGRSRVSNVTFSYLPTSGDNPTIDGRIEFESSTNAVAAHGKASVNYGLKGDFPLGTTKGSVEITAPQLAEALTINYEVRKRRAKWIIFFFIILGLLVGYVLRTKLKSEIELNKARLKAIDLQDRINKEKQHHADEDFHAKLIVPLNTLNTAVRGRDASAIATAITAADAALTEALNDLKQRRVAVETNLYEMNRLELIAKDLPDSIREPFHSIIGPLEEVRQEIGKDNVKAADRMLETIRANLVEKIQQPVMEWRTYMWQYLEELNKPEVLLPAAVATNLSKAVESLTPIFNQVPDVSQDATTDKIKGTLAAIQTARLNVAELMVQLRAWLQVTAAGVIAILSQIQIPDQQTLEQLSEAITKFSDEAAASALQPQKAIQELPNALQELHKAWSSALLMQIPDADQKDKDDVKELIKNRNYADAARMVVQIIEKKKEEARAEGKVLGSLSAGPATLPVITSIFSPWFAGATAGTAAVVTRIERVEETYEPVEAQRASTMGELLRETLLQTILVGFLITLAGYMLFAEKFVGTMQDLTGIFFWAFGIDISVDALLQVAKGIKT